MRLWIEEDFRVADVGLDRASEVGSSQVMKIAHRAQHPGSLIVEIEKVLQVLELVRAAERFHAAVAKRHAVAGGQLEHQLGLERTLEVHVQFRLRDPADEHFKRRRGSQVTLAYSSSR